MAGAKPGPLAAAAVGKTYTTRCEGETGSDEVSLLGSLSMPRIFTEALDQDVLVIRLYSNTCTLRT